jgi:stress-induced morphogen
MFNIVIESPVFSEKTKLEQHKMVMDAISDDM